MHDDRVFFVKTLQGWVYKTQPTSEMHDALLMFLCNNIARWVYKTQPACEMHWCSSDVFFVTILQGWFTKQNQHARCMMLFWFFFVTINKWTISKKTFPNVLMDVRNTKPHLALPVSINVEVWQVWSVHPALGEPWATRSQLSSMSDVLSIFGGLRVQKTLENVHTSGRWTERPVSMWARRCSRRDHWFKWFGSYHNRANYDQPIVTRCVFVQVGVAGLPRRFSIHRMFRHERPVDAFDARPIALWFYDRSHKDACPGTKAVVACAAIIRQLAYILGAWCVRASMSRTHTRPNGTTVRMSTWTRQAPHNS